MLHVCTLVAPALTRNAAIANYRKAQLLALEIEHVHHILESQKPLERKRTLQYFARELRLLPTVIRTSTRSLSPLRGSEKNSL